MKTSVATWPIMCETHFSNNDHIQNFDVGIINSIFLNLPDVILNYICK